MGIDHHSKTFKNYTLCSLLYLFSVLLIRKKSDEIFRFFFFFVILIYCLIHYSPLYEDSIFIMVEVLLILLLLTIIGFLEFTILKRMIMTSHFSYNLEKMINSWLIR